MPFRQSKTNKQALFFKKFSIVGKRSSQFLCISPCLITSVLCDVSLLHILIYLWHTSGELLVSLIASFVSTTSTGAQGDCSIALFDKHCKLLEHKEYQIKLTITLHFIKLHYITLDLRMFRFMKFVL